MKTTIFLTCIILTCIAIAGAHIAGRYRRKQAAESSRTITVRKEAIVWDIQAHLKGLDNPRYDPGPIDGEWGPKTDTAARTYSGDNSALPYFAGMEQEK